MGARRLALLGAGIVALGLAFGGLWGPGGAPRDVPLPGPLPEGALRIVTFGTSLTAPPQSWPAHLARHLQACRGAPVALSRVAGVGQGSDWAVTALEQVTRQAPDLVLVEFAINDADLRDGLSLELSRRTHLELIARLHEDLPEAQIVLLTMSPAQGLRGWIRPWLGAHYAQYHDLAREQGLGLVDVYPRWQALPRSARGLQRDGLHPDPDVAGRVILPALIAALAPDCTD